MGWILYFKESDDVRNICMMSYAVSHWYFRFELFSTNLVSAFWTFQRVTYYVNEKSLLKMLGFFIFQFTFYADFYNQIRQIVWLHSSLFWLILWRLPLIYLVNIFNVNQSQTTYNALTSSYLNQHFEPVLTQPRNVVVFSLHITLTLTQCSTSYYS